jgi:hypothetical protein
LNDPYLFCFENQLKLKALISFIDSNDNINAYFIAYIEKIAILIEIIEVTI